MWGVIAELEAGRELPEAGMLSPRERTAVLNELKSIMAVYAGSCAAS